MSDYQMETRRRSRSKTPFLRSSCDHETCTHAGEEGHVHQHQKKPAAVAPNVQTITEETVEVTSSSSTPSAKQTQSKAQLKTKTSDYSSEDNSPDNKTKKYLAESKQQYKQSASSSSTTTTTTTSTSATTVIKSKKLSSGSFLGSRAATSTPKGRNYILESYASQFCNTGTGEGGGGGLGLKEVAQNQLNSEFERSQRSVQANSSKTNKSFSRILGNSFNNAAHDQSINNADLSNHLAYVEYKKAGEYWKTTPKTDYTYSELSPHRRELAPGVVAMPNMSRRSLENHHERINYMIERDPAQAEFIRRRYETSKYAQNRGASEKLMYDSGDEVDYSQYEDYRKKSQYYNGTHLQNTSESWFVRFITTIVTSMTSVWTILAGGSTSVDESFLYRTKYDTNQERGFFGSIAHGISSAFAAFFRYIYLFISSVLYLDTWLLKSSNAENKNKKRFLLFLLILLPLLLLAGLYYYLHPNESFPPKNFSEFTFTLPTLPKIDMSEYLNQENYEALKAQASNRLDDFRSWTDDYLLYLRTVSQNIADEGRKLFRREEYYERV